MINEETEKPKIEKNEIEYAFDEQPPEGESSYECC